MKRSNNFKIAAALILGLTAIFWLIKGVVDIIGGSRGGINNIFLAVALFLLGFFAWKRPLIGGIAIAVLGVFLIIYFNLILPDIYIMAVSFFFMFAPMEIAGLLFIEADWALKKKNR